MFVLSGAHAFASLTTRMEYAETLLRLKWRLGFQDWDWPPAVATSPDRQWVEGAALLLASDPDQIAELARFHGQHVVLRWDEDGMAPTPTMPGDVGDPTPVPVQLVPATTGCPLRGGADGVCKVYGGPRTSSSIAAAHV